MHILFRIYGSDNWFWPSFHINNDFIYIKNLRDNSNILFVLNVKLTGKSLPVYVRDVYPAKDFFLQKYKFSVYISIQKQTSTNERIKTETIFLFNLHFLHFLQNMVPQASSSILLTEILYKTFLVELVLVWTIIIRSLFESFG